MEEERKTARPRGTDSAKIVQVIETKSIYGIGTTSDPCRIITQYWDFDGNMLAESDPVNRSVLQGGD